MVELGQAVFGNKWETLDCPRYVEDGLYSLGRFLALKEEGKWDGWWSEFENETFAMRPYYWGECECGYENAEWEWSDNHNHFQCYQNELALIDNTQRWHSKAYDHNVEALCQKYGLPYPNGSAIHCTCTHQSEWIKWQSLNDHDPTCHVVLPNFQHFASDLAVHWYKHIGRSTTINKELGFLEWQDIFDACRKSIDLVEGQIPKGAGALPKQPLI